MVSCDKDAEVPVKGAPGPAKPRRRLRWLGLGGALVLIGILALDHWLPYMLLSHYKFSVDPNPRILNEYAATCESIEFTTIDGLAIRGWFIPASAESRRPAPTIIVLHTLGGTRADMLAFALPLWKEGFNLALIDMRGHGESEGEFFTYGYHEWRDVTGLLDWLEKREDGAGKNVVVLGASAGGAVAINTAAHDERIDALVSIAAFADLESIAQHRASWLPSCWRRRALRKAEALAQFKVADVSPARQIQSVSCPTLIAHGDADTFVPFADGQKLFTSSGAAHKEFYVIRGADHATMFAKRAEELHAKIVTLARAACVLLPPE